MLYGMDRLCITRMINDNLHFSWMHVRVCDFSEVESVRRQIVKQNCKIKKNDQANSTGVCVDLGVMPWVRKA